MSKIERCSGLRKGLASSGFTYECRTTLEFSILVRGVWHVGHCVALNASSLSVCDAKDADAYAKAASMVEDLLTSLLLGRSHSSNALRNN